MHRKPVIATVVEDDFGSWPFASAGPFGHVTRATIEPKRVLPAPSVRVTSHPGHARVFADLPHCSRRSVSVSVRPSQRTGVVSEVLLKAVQENPDPRRFELTADLRQVAPGAVVFEKTFALPWHTTAEDVTAKWVGDNTLVLSIPERETVAAARQTHQAPRPKKTEKQPASKPNSPAKPAVTIAANVHPLLALLTGGASPRAAATAEKQTPATLPDVPKLKEVAEARRAAAAAEKQKLEAALARRREAEEQLEVAQRLAREAAAEVARAAAAAAEAEANATRAARALSDAEETHRRHETEAKARAAAKEKEEEVKRRLAKEVAAFKAKAEAKAKAKAEAEAKAKAESEAKAKAEAEAARERATENVATAEKSEAAPSASSSSDSSSSVESRDVSADFIDMFLDGLVRPSLRRRLRAQHQKKKASKKRAPGCAGSCAQKCEQAEHTCDASPAPADGASPVAVPIPIVITPAPAQEVVTPATTDSDASPGSAEPKAEAAAAEELDAAGPAAAAPEEAAPAAAPESPAAAEEPPAPARVPAGVSSPRSSTASNKSWAFRDAEVEIRDPTEDEDREMSSYRDICSQPTLSSESASVEIVKIPE